MEQVNYSDWISIVDIAWGERWQIHRRLQELKIPCKCSTGQLLLVTVDTPTAAIQVWSVTRTQSLDRSQLVDWLDRCFTIPAVGIASARRENRHGSELHDR
ncbi:MULTISPECIES: Asr1405/Asl0597 family protein [unclassified Chamaesiphon]|uniref:Asr1405/Asl0597 family protein n=1 Tax=unclassified Chamaesiphon TaxID=2620921 RepID=UPI00286AC76F|nr:MULTISPECIES: Asr1405/Asl0597 family protein [unclassified Chamaesiphon]